MQPHRSPIQAQKSNANSNDVLSSSAPTMSGPRPHGEWSAIRVQNENRDGDTPHTTSHSMSAPSNDEWDPPDHWEEAYDEPVAPWPTYVTMGESRYVGWEHHGQNANVNTAYGTSTAVQYSSSSAEYTTLDTNIPTYGSLQSPPTINFGSQQSQYSDYSGQGANQGQTSGNQNNESQSSQYDALPAPEADADDASQNLALLDLDNSPTAVEAAHEALVHRLEDMERTGVYWTGTAERYDVDYNSLNDLLRSQLAATPERLLGGGGFGVVHEVNPAGIRMVRKNLLPLSSRDVRAEVAAIRRLQGHHHIVTIVGSFVTENDRLNILIFPRADCNFDDFLDDCNTMVGPEAEQAQVRNMLRRVGKTFEYGNSTASNVAQVHSFLRECMGCITKAILWMHLNDISHQDLKPLNILLRNGVVYLTDFGISNDRSRSQLTHTRSFFGASLGYTSPEMEAVAYRFEGNHSPKRDDVYSLGCIFMHMLSVLYHGWATRTDCEQCLQEKNPVQRRTEIVNLCDIFLEAQVPHALVNLVLRMLDNDRYQRPHIEGVDSSLSRIGGTAQIYHGICCKSKSHRSSTSYPADEQEGSTKDVNSKAGKEEGSSSKSKGSYDQRGKDSKSKSSSAKGSSSKSRGADEQGSRSKVSNSKSGSGKGKESSSKSNGTGWASEAEQGGSSRSSHKGKLR